MGIDQLSPEVHTFANRLIRRKSRQLAAKESFSASDHDDVAQDLWLHLLERLGKFDPQKGTIFAFIVTVIERKAISMMRLHSAARRDGGRCSSLNEFVRAEDGSRVELGAKLTNDADQRLCEESHDPQGDIELALDVETVIKRLPPELRDLCERLKTDSQAEIARELGIPRTTLQSRIKKLRDSGNNMVIVTENEFDGGLDGGDNLLTSQTQYVD